MIIVRKSIFMMYFYFMRLWIGIWLGNFFKTHIWIWGWGFALFGTLWFYALWLYSIAISVNLKLSTNSKFKKLEFSKIGSRFVFPICRKKFSSATKLSRKWPFQILIFEKLPVRWRDRAWFASRQANFFLIARGADEA